MSIKKQKNTIIILTNSTNVETGTQGVYCPPKTILLFIDATVNPFKIHLAISPQMYFYVVNDKTRISNPQCQKSRSTNKNIQINKCSQEPNQLLIEHQAKSH